MNLRMDQTLDASLTRRPGRRRTIAVGMLVFVVIVSALLVLRPDSHSRALYPESAGPPWDASPIATGTLDGVVWKQFVWSTPDGQTCLYFSAGASMANCGHWDNEIPFAIMGSDSPVTVGQRGATTVVIQGVLRTDVTSVRIVEPDNNVAASLQSARTAAMKYAVPVFMLPVTRRETAIDNDGRYVMVGAFDGRTELGRIRVPVLNLGYCGSEMCT
jgi:hypothetical protein